MIEKEEGRDRLVPGGLHLRRARRAAGADAEDPGRGILFGGESCEDLPGIAGRQRPQSQTESLAQVAFQGGDQPADPFVTGHRDRPPA